MSGRIKNILTKVRTRPYKLDGDENIVKDLAEEVNSQTLNATSSIIALQGAVDTLETDVGTLQTDVGTLQGDVSALVPAVGSCTDLVETNGYNYIRIGDGNYFAPTSAYGPWVFGSILLGDIVERMPNVGDAAEFKYRIFVLDTTTGVLKFTPVDTLVTIEHPVAATADELIEVTLLYTRMSTTTMAVETSYRIINTALPTGSLTTKGILGIDSLTGAANTGLNITWTWTSIPDPAGVLFVYSHMKTIRSTTTPIVLTS